MANLAEVLGDWPLFREEVAWEQAQEALDQQALSDGLPLVPPTESRLQAMLAGVAAPSKSHGQMLPLFGDLTAAAVAYNCVLAGCVPGAVPVVLTAAKACLEAEFNLLGILTTTGTPAVATVVHGPIAKVLGMSAGTNCLGPGNRGNASLGRAMSLVMRNIGGARAEIGDMATMGQPGKYTFCFAEGDDETFPSLAQRRGLDEGTSAVTVLGVSGTIEVLPEGGGETAEAILSPIAAALAASAKAASAGRLRQLGEQVFLLPPEMVQQLTKLGWGLGQVQNFLFDAGAPAKSAADIHAIVTGGAGVKMTCLPLWAGGTISVTKALDELGS